MRHLILLIVIPSLVEATSKKGFGLCGAAYKCGDTYALSDTSWWYNWHPTRTEYQNHKCSKYPRGDFVPTIWGERDLHATLPSNTKYVLAFNEPNAQNQANLSPEAAARLWPQIEKMAGSRIIVGPGLTSCDTHPEWCTGWFDRFFKACPNCRVNHMAMHAYHCDPQKIMHSLQLISKRYGKKVWLTEFACETSKSEDDQIHLVKTLIPQLEKADYVYRYAWFCSRLRDDGHHWNLINLNSPTLNKLGQAYNQAH